MDDDAQAAAPGRRERKKQRVRQDLTTAAFTLFADRDFDQVTVEQIADAADVSRTTFFRYFETKESVVVGYLRDVALQARDAVLARPADEPPLRALRTALAEVARLRSADDDRAAVLERLRRQSPVVRAAYRDKLDEWSALLAGALSTRLGVDPATALEPRLYARVAMAVVAAATELWEATGRTDDIEELLDRAFALVTPDDRRPCPRSG